MKKTQILMNNSFYLGLSMLDLTKNVMYEFWYDYIKPKYGENTKLRYMDTDSFIVHVKTDDIYKYIPKDVRKRFDTSNNEVYRPLPKEKNKKNMTGLMKHELGGQILKKKCWIKSKSI